MSRHGMRALISSPHAVETPSPLSYSPKMAILVNQPPGAPPAGGLAATQEKDPRVRSTACMQAGNGGGRVPLGAPARMGDNLTSEVPSTTSGLMLQPGSILHLPRSLPANPGRDTDAA
jgi:hypothetical protein